MSGGNIVGWRNAPPPEAAQDAGTQADAPPPDVFDDFAFTDDGYRAPSPWRVAVPVLLAVVAVGWVGALLWLARDSLAMLPPLALAQFAAALLAVPLVAGVAWLLLLRTSYAEATRFGATARAMREEAASLERTVTMLAAAIETNRAALGEQVALLTTLGDQATERLAAIGRGLSEEIDQADIHARSLAQAADGAQANLQVLLTTLPRATEETRALGESISATGLGAGERAAALDAQVVALAARGREAETVAGGAAEKLAAHVARMEATSETAGARLERVTAEMAGAVDALLDRTAQAIDQSRQGLAAQGDALLAMVGANQAALDSSARESAEALAARIAVVEQVIDRIATRLATQHRAGDAMVSDLEQGVARASDQLDALHAQGVERGQALAQTLDGLRVSASGLTRVLVESDELATRAIGGVEGLLGALDAAAREVDETLPEALARLDARVHATRAGLGGAKPELLALVSAGESVHDAVTGIAQAIAEQRRASEQAAALLDAALGAGQGRVDALAQSLGASREEAHRFADEAAPRLVEALLRVRDTATAAAERARETLATVIPEAADALEAAGADALRRAASSTVEEQVAGIAAVAEAAVAAAERAGRRLETQAASIAATLAAVEERFAEEEVRESFARRSAQLIEALHSGSVDLTRSLSAEVADSAWAAYLKGDRGVFTRRAVRLLDGGEARDVLRRYEEDAGFRDQVNRYVHDFEGMLRGVLAQRDGSALGLALLSSDIGKLYVALAQAIERLR